MQVPLKIVFEGMDPSPAIEKLIRDEAAALEQFYDRITSCRVVFERPHRHQHKGNVYAVRIHLDLPGQRDVIIDRSPGKDHRHEDPYLTVRDAFHEARRQLQDQVRIRRGKVKAHEAVPHGKVARIFLEEGYGFIETVDEREVYFHRNSIVTGDFDHLEIGQEVRCSEEMGEEGPQASSLHVIGKHHSV